MLVCACGQKKGNNIDKAEIEFLENCRIIDDYRDYYYYEFNGNNFVKLLKKHPESMEYDFQLLRDSIYHFYFTDSDDGKIRAYFLDYGGTMHCVGLIAFQYKDNNGEVHTQQGSIYDIDETGAYHDTYFEGNCASDFNIFSLELAQKTVYFVHHIHSYHFEGSEGYTAFVIDGNKLKRRVLFKDEKNISSSIGINFNYNLQCETNVGFGALIEFSEKDSIFYISVINENDCPTDIYKSYQWDGKYFTYTGTGKLNSK